MFVIISVPYIEGRDQRYREFVLKPHFPDVYRSPLTFAFNPHLSFNKNYVELALLATVFDLNVMDLCQRAVFDPRSLSLDPAFEIPDFRNLHNFMEGKDWRAFSGSPSVDTYKRLVGLLVDIPLREKVIPASVSGTSVDNILVSLVAENPGVAVGDWHGEYCVTEYLCGVLSVLKESGVSTLYFEMVDASEQDKLDQYMQDGDVEAFSRVSSFRLWAKKNPGMMQQYFNVIEMARVLDIRVVAINWEGVGNRFYDSNALWSDVIIGDRAKVKDGDKFIVFGGRYHFCDWPPNELYPPMSVSKRLGIPSVQICTSDDGLTSEIRLGEGDSESDFILSLPESPNQRRFIDGSIDPVSNRGGPASRELYVKRSDYIEPPLTRRKTSLGGGVCK